MTTLYKVEANITIDASGYLPEAPDAKVEGRQWPEGALVELSAADAEYFFANHCLSLHTPGLKAGQIADPPPLELPEPPPAAEELPDEAKTDPDAPQARRRGR